MQKMDKLTHERLKPYEKYMATAVRANYITTLVNRQLIELEEIAQPLGIKLAKRSCPQCVFDFVLKLGRLYYAYKEEPVVEEKPQEVVKEVKTDGKETKETKKGRGRKKTNSGSKKV